MKSTRSALTPRKITEYCDLRLAPILEPDEVGSLRQCLVGLLEHSEYPPYRGSKLDIGAVSELLGLDAERLNRVRNNLQPIFDAWTCPAFVESV